jgi:hypothetical protein
MLTAMLSHVAFFGRHLMTLSPDVAFLMLENRLKDT